MNNKNNILFNLTYLNNSIYAMYIVSKRAFTKNKRNFIAVINQVEVEL